MSLKIVVSGLLAAALIVLGVVMNSIGASASPVSSDFQPTPVPRSTSMNWTPFATPDGLGGTHLGSAPFACCGGIVGEQVGGSK